MPNSLQEIQRWKGLQVLVTKASEITAETSGLAAEAVELLKGGMGL